MLFGFLFICNKNNSIWNKHTILRSHVIEQHDYADLRERLIQLKNVLHDLV